MAFQMLSSLTIVSHEKQTEKYNVFWYSEQPHEFPEHPLHSEKVTV